MGTTPQAPKPARTRRGTPSGLTVPDTVGAFAPLKGGEGERADGDGDGKTGGGAGELHRERHPPKLLPMIRRTAATRPPA